jgi:hypothetical protein
VITPQISSDNHPNVSDGLTTDGLCTSWYNKSMTLIAVSTILTYASPFISVTLTLPCIAIILIAEGACAYGGISDWNSDNDNNYLDRETKDSTAFLFPNIVNAFKQIKRANQNKGITKWLNQVKPVAG